MSIQSAINFMSKIDTEPEFRKECYTCKSKAELMEMLKVKDLSFNMDEFEDAVNHLLVRCDTYSQAHKVRELEAWFKIFH